MKSRALPIFLSLMVLSAIAVPANPVSPQTSGSGAIAQTSINPLGPAERAWDLIRLARRFRANQQPDQAIQALVEAEQLSGLLSNTVTRDRILVQVVTDLAALERFEQAIALTERISDTSQVPEVCCLLLRHRAEVAITKAYLQAGQEKQAQQFATATQSPLARDRLRTEIVDYLANQGRFAEAATLAKQIQDSTQASLARLAMVQARLMDNRWDQATALAKSAPDPNERSALLTTIAQWASRAGQYDIAAQTISEIQATGDRARGWVEVALAYRWANQPGRALAVLSQAYQLDPSIVPNSRWAGYFAQIGAFDRATSLIKGLQGYEKGMATLELAQARSQAGQYREAIALIQQVQEGDLQPFGDMADPKVEAVQQMIRQANQARRYDVALQAANSLKLGQNRTQALRLVAQGYRQTNQMQKAAEVLDQAVAAAKTVERLTIFIDRNTAFTVTNAGLLLDLVRDYLAMNQPQQAIALLGDSRTSAQQLLQDNPYAAQRQVEYLGAIARLYSNLNQRNQALAAAEGALKLAERLPSDSQSAFLRVQTLADVAAIFGIAGAEQPANRVLSEAQRLSQTIPPSSQAIWTETAMVRAYAALGQTPQVLASVEAALKRLSFLPEHEQIWLRERLAVAAAGEDPAYAQQLVQLLPNRAQQIPILAQMAVNYHAIGQVPQAQAVVIRLQQVAETLPQDGEAESLLNDVIRNYFAPQGARNLSISQLLHAGQLNHDLPDAFLKAYNWAQIAQAYAAQGEAGRANQTMGFALEVVRGMSDRFDQRDLLWQILEETLRSGNRSLALQVVNQLEGAEKTGALQRVNFNQE